MTEGHIDGAQHTAASTRNEHSHKEEVPSRVRGKFNLLALFGRFPFNRKRNKTDRPASEHAQREDHFQLGEHQNPIFYDPKYVFRMEPTTNSRVHEPNFSQPDGELGREPDPEVWEQYANMFAGEFEKQLAEINALALQERGTGEEAN